MLRVKLRYLEAWTEAPPSRCRATTTRRLPAAASTRPGSPTTPPRLPRLCDPHARRATWQQALTAKGIQTGIHYPIPVHLQPAYADAR